MGWGRRVGEQRGELKWGLYVEIGVEGGEGREKRAMDGRRGF